MFPDLYALKTSDYLNVDFEQVYQYHTVEIFFHISWVQVIYSFVDIFLCKEF